MLDSAAYRPPLLYHVTFGSKNPYAVHTSFVVAVPYVIKTSSGIFFHSRGEATANTKVIRDIVITRSASVISRMFLLELAY